MRGIQVQTAYNLMFPQRLPMSSAPLHTLSRFHFINKWFCPATPQAKLGRAGVITGTGGGRGGVKRRKQAAEWMVGNEKEKNITDYILLAWRHLHSVVPLCLLAIVSKQLWRINGHTLTSGVSWDAERQPAACPRQLPRLPQLSVRAVVWSSFPDKSRIAFWDLTFIHLQETVFLVILLSEHSRAFPLCTEFGSFFFFFFFINKSRLWIRF